jgi:predicted permease
MLLIGAALTSQTVWALTHVQPGWSAAGTWIVEPRFTADQYRSALSMTAFEQQAAAQALLLPGMEQVALAESVPLLNPSISFGTIESENVTIPDAVVSVNHVTGGYFKALGIPLIAGRSFQNEPAAPGDEDLGNVIVTRDMAARLWPKGNAVGQRMHFHFDSTDAATWFTVIGVVGDVQTFSFDSLQEPLELYRVLPASNRARWITVRTKGTQATTPRDIREIVHRLDSNLAVDIRPMDEIYDVTLAAPKFQTSLFTGFAILTLILAIAGLYAVVAYEAKRKSREISIRIALGAKRPAAIREVVRSFLLMSCCGIFGAAFVSVALTRWMATMLYSIRPNDPGTFLLAAAVLLAATFLAAFLPAYRATRVNPAVELRSD